MKDKKKAPNVLHIIKNNCYILKLAIKEAPIYTLDELFQGILHSVVVFIEHIYMIAFIVDSIQYQRPFQDVLIFICSVFFSLLIIMSWGNYRVTRLKPKAMEKITKKLRLSLYKKATQIDLECYDNPEFYNDFVWAMNDAPDRVGKVIMTTSNFLGGIAGIFVVGGYIFTKDTWGILFAVLSFVLFLVFGSSFVKLKFKLETEVKPKQRKRDYINRVLYLSEYAKEIRLSNIKGKLYEDFKASVDDIEKTNEKHGTKISVFWFLSEFVCGFLIMDGLYVLYLMFMTIVKKAFSYGTMYSLYNSVSNFSRTLSDLAKVTPEFQQHSMYIDKIRGFLDYEVKIKSAPDSIDMPKETQSIKMKNVTFSYDGQKDIQLKNINLEIKRGQKVALVGYNGAGKTTLVKLLMRLYDVTNGEIEYNGMDIRDYKVDEYRNAFATVFQDYQIFSATLGQNIIMSNDEIDGFKAAELLAVNGFDDRFRELINGLDTPLTKEFEEDGVNLSGGEAQKVAITRAMYKDADIIILDEPSSALDPIAEYELNKSMVNIGDDKTVIFISHRLSTTKMADMIYMLEEGCIIESGTHDRLLELNGKYAEMFNLQAEKYR